MFCLSKRRTTLTKVDDDDPLCSICSAFNIRTILRTGIRKEHAIHLGLLTDILKKQHQCGLCHLIAIHFSLPQPGIDPGAITCTLYTMAHPTRLNHRDACHRLYVGINDNAYIAIRLLKEADSKTGGPKELHVQRVGQNVDVGQLKGWIRTCKKKHREKCETDWWRDPGKVLPSTVRVVDVARMAIVPAPPRCRYVALSYVWGSTGEGYWTTKANLQQRGISGGLDASILPDTISDTIQLLRQLGEQYLWIDALCIVQDDPGDKAVQIRVMELIYGSSVFTVFAVAGTSVRDPLPGVRPGTRDPKQHTAKIQGIHLALPLPEFREVIDRSVWNERGWTYQEAMLSRRRIFFTAQQVHFECRNDIYSEERPAAVFPMAVFGQVIPGSVPASMTRESYLRFYMRVVEDYTRRKLTLESDIEDAVAALLRGLTRGFELADDYEKAFRFGMLLTGSLDQALLWQPSPDAPHSRRVPTNEMRVMWPSWSWAAWRGAVSYCGEEVFDNIHMGQSYGHNNVKQSLVEWYIVDDAGQPVRLYVEHRKRIVHEPGFNLIMNIAYVPPKGDIDPQQLIAENAPLLPGTLVFRTSYSHFDVIKADDVQSADVVANYAIYSILSNIPQPSTLVGRIILPSSIHSPTPYEFIVLSRAIECIGYYDEERLGKRYSGCMLYVMAVQKMQDGKRFERVGVGIIFEQAWLSSKPEEKIVYLG